MGIKWDGFGERPQLRVKMRLINRGSYYAWQSLIVDQHNNVFVEDSMAADTHTYDKLVKEALVDLEALNRALGLGHELHPWDWVEV